MARQNTVTEVKVEDITFSPTIIKPPGSTNTFFLGGAGVRGLQIQDKFIKFTAIAVYLEEEKAIPFLALKWKGKTVDELENSDDFYLDIITGPFEKIVLVKMISQLMGQQYAMGLTENCIKFWKTLGNYTESKDKGLLEELIQVFQDEIFPPNSTILFTQSSPTLTIGFSEDGSIPKEGKANIENKRLSEAILGTVLCKGGVSPAARRSLAVRLCDLFKVEEQKAAKC